MLRTLGVRSPFFESTDSLWCFPFLFVLSGCEAKPECDTFETRNAVLQTVSNDHKNPLVEYAAKSSNMAKSTAANLEAEKSKRRPFICSGRKDNHNINE
jgi:hypothetical protein